MVILGIDPAIRTTGYGVIRIMDGRMEVLDCGVIRNPVKAPHSECLRRLSGGIRELVKQFQPEAASIEEPFQGRNASTAIILGMARGAIVAALAENAVPCYAYSPKSAKKSAVGNGSAEKEQVAMMMAAQFHIEVGAIPLDATDALALAVCHGQLAMRGAQVRDLLTSPI